MIVLRISPALVLASLASLGCATFHPPNAPLEQVDSAHGYRPNIPENFRETGPVMMTMAFSGGGTRAAAFAYGVMEELHEAQVRVAGETTSLLDHVDTISGVSGGSFPAAYYGLFGDRIFEEFEERFLKYDIQGALVRRILRPKNLFRLLSPNTSRSALAAQYYDENVFEGATFKDLTEAKGPRIYINATDLSRGYRFTFGQGMFDLICSDLDSFPVSSAVASSSAVPGLLSPITLANRAGTCGYEPPPWLEQALSSRDNDSRRYRAAKGLVDYLDVEERPYVHLIDGGISDNLGLRASLESAALAGGVSNLAKIFGMSTLPDRMVLVIVNAETDPNPTIDLSAQPPGIAMLMNAVSGSQIRRYNFETILLARDAVRQAARELSTPGHTVMPYFVEVSFDSIEDETERRYFKGLATSFRLADHEVDELRAMGRRLLREAPGYRKLLEALR